LIHLVTGLHRISHDYRANLIRLQARQLKSGALMAVAPSSTAGISFNVPPNVPMAVRTGSASRWSTLMSWKDSAEDKQQNPSTLNCCATDDFGRAIFAIALIPGWNVRSECSR
jgi:hypothetical protein